MKKTILTGTISFLSDPERSVRKIDGWSYEKIGILDDGGTETFVENVTVTENMLGILKVGSEGQFLFAKPALQPTSFVAHKSNHDSELLSDPEYKTLKNWTLTWLVGCPISVFICQILAQHGHLEKINEMSKITGGAVLLVALMGAPIWSKTLDAYSLRRIGTKFLAS